MFDGTLGNYASNKYKIELLEGSQPYHAKRFHEETLKKELNRLINIEVLKRKH